MVSVSYTHLDVYKRQVPAWVLSRMVDSNEQNAIFVNAIDGTIINLSLIHILLIVEDEKPISDLIRLNLMKAGYSCTCAFDGMLSLIHIYGKTFEDNALIKARAIAAHTDAIVLADDSGLEIDYLNKEQIGRAHV